jgi:hypothetical protein
MDRDAVLTILNGIDAQVATLDTNYLGQEGRGAATDLQRKVRKIIEGWKNVVRELPPADPEEAGR